MRVARVLFLNGGLEGHVNPTLELVRELIGRGEDVVYITTDPLRGRVEETGAVVRTFDGARFSESMRSGDVRHFLGVATGLLRTADVVIPRVLDEIRGEHFDYIIHDTMLGSGRILAEVLKLPAIASCTTFARQRSTVDGMLESLSARLPGDEYSQMVQDFRAQRDAVNQKYGVTLDSVHDAYSNPAPMTLVYTSRYFQPEEERFDESFKFVGPTGKVPTAGRDELLDMLREPLVYISLGTVFNQAPEFYQLCFEALQGTRYQVVLSVGTKTTVADLGPIPDNFLVRNYVPQVQVLDCAQLFVTHGGMNSVSEGLLHGVPLVVFPQGADQFAVAARVGELGAGVSLQQRDLSPVEFRNTIDRVLEDAAVSRICHDIGASLRAAGGATRAVDEVFSFKKAMGLD